jgi:predicted transcriptional regulator
MVDSRKTSSTAADSSMLVARVLEGMTDADAGRMIATEELLQQVESWETTGPKARGLEGRQDVSPG